MELEQRYLVEKTEPLPNTTHREFYQIAMKSAQKLDPMLLIGSSSSICPNFGVIECKNWDHIRQQ